MPTPHKRRRYPKPGPVTVQRPGEETKIVRADDFPGPRPLWSYAPTARDEYLRPTSAMSEFERHELHRRYALKMGDVVVPLVKRGGELQWFVIDMDPREHTITACTLMMGVRREDTFRFDEIDVREPESGTGANEAEAMRRRLGIRRRRAA